MAREPRNGQWRNVLVGVVVGMLLMAAAPVVAAVGDPILLGLTNSATKRTTIRGAADGSAMLRVVNEAEVGSGIDVRVEAGRPPFLVNSTARVRKLNADRIDGKHVRDLMLKARYDKDTNRVVDDAERLDGLDSTSFVTKAGSWSCPGNTWVAASSFDEYRTSGPLVSVGIGSASAVVRCGVVLPQDVRVTAVAFAVQDSSTTAGVECALYRTGVRFGLGTTDQLVSEATSGAPGATVLVTDAIAFWRIDNARYAYYAGCTIAEDGWDTGVYGVTISYDAPPVGAEDE